MSLCLKDSARAEVEKLGAHEMTNYRVSLENRGVKCIQI